MRGRFPGTAALVLSGAAALFTSIFPTLADDIWFADQVEVSAQTNGANAIPVKGEGYSFHVVPGDSTWAYTIEFTSVPAGASIEVGKRYYISQKSFNAAHKYQEPGTPVQRLPLQQITRARAQVSQQLDPAQTQCTTEITISKTVAVAPAPVAATNSTAVAHVPGLLQMRRVPADPTWTYKASDEFIAKSKFDQPLQIISRDQWGAKKFSAKELQQMPDLGPVTGVVIHHAESAMNWDMKSMEADHIRRKFPTVGYQYVIALDKNGDWQVYEGFPGGKKGYHVTKNNTGQVGICIMGSYEEEGAGMKFGFRKGASESEKQPMKGADEKLGELIAKLQRDNPGLRDGKGTITGHAEGEHGLVKSIVNGAIVPYKQCPGEGCLHVIEALRRRFAMTAPYEANWYNSDKKTWEKHSSEEIP